jgi:hypothetical protein
LHHTVIHHSAPPAKKAKPAGVLGAEIWVNILAISGPSPTDPAVTHGRYFFVH